MVAKQGTDGSWIVADESVPELLVAEPLFADGPSSVSVADFERVDGVEFFRVCVSSAPYSYELRRRYSQFEALARSMGGTARKHPLPSKYLGRHTDANVAARARALEAWLHAVLADASCSHDVQLYVRPFLELDAAKALTEQHATARENRALEELDADVPLREPTADAASAAAPSDVPVSAERRKLLEELNEKVRCAPAPRALRTTCARSLCARLRARGCRPLSSALTAWPLPSALSLSLARRTARCAGWRRA